MSNSKARFTSPTNKLGKSVSGAIINGSKRENKAGQVGSGTPAPTKGGPVQVIFNGKIVTPQSLIVRKSGGHSDRSKRPKPLLQKPQTIDESASDAGEKTSSALSSKLNLKSRMDLSADSNRNVSKFNIAANKSKVEKEETFTVMLTETVTTIHLSLASFQVASDTRDVMAVDERNARYEASVKAHANVDGFSTRATQTKNNQLKHQNEMAAPNAFKDSGSQAISYEIKDEIAQLNTVETDTDVASSLGVGTETKVDDLQGLNPSVRKFVLDTVGVALVTPGCLLDTTQAVKPPAPGDASKPHAGTGASGKHGNKGKSMVSMAAGNNKSMMSMGNTSEMASGEDVLHQGTGGGASGFFGKAVSTASSENNTASGTDVVTGHNQTTNNNASRANDSTMDSEDGSVAVARGGGETFTEEDSLQLVRDNEIRRILGQPMLLKRLQMIERAIQQNANYRNQLDYRDLPDIAPLMLVSPENRAKSAVGGADGDVLHGGGVGGLGKSSLHLKKFGEQRNNTNGPGAGGQSQYFSDTASVMSADDNASNATSNHGSTSNLHGNAGSERGGKGGKIDAAFLLSDAAKVKKLFTYANPALIEGRSVTAMAWNAVSSDLLAVGYGRLSDTIAGAKAAAADGIAASSSAAHLPATDGNPATTANTTTTSSTGIPSDESQQGLVLFWSLRNPDYPEKILRTSHSVTALDFSRQHPMILAVGLHNGDVNIYDVKREGGQAWGVPVESSAGMAEAHLDPVWHLKWIVRGVERLETLVSISTDGRVLEWNLKKGLVMSKLMDLKKSGTGEGWISNAAAGLSLDFHPEDPTTYVTGTEDGALHKCSVSYNEQYLETYSAHAGPVYKVRFSPRWSNIFLTCSADWNMHLYHMNHKVPLFTMRGTGETYPVNDICWCNDNSTVFAAVTVDAKLQIWDLSVSAIDPVVTIDVGAEDRVNTPAAGGGGGQLGEEDDLLGDNFDGGPALNAATLNMGAGSPPMSAAAAAARFLDPQGLNNNNAHLPPMQRLLKSLATEPRKRLLTTVLFGEKNPIVAVGDSRGNVNVYRVFDPLTITHLGPLQQFQKLKAAIVRQTDPAVAGVLQSETNHPHSSNNNSNVNSNNNTNNNSSGSILNNAHAEVK